MSHSRNKVPLGAVLQQAGLVSADQVKLALIEQEQTKKSLRIGEILASQGHIKPKTADFFAERWSTVVRERERQPIGQYLKQAALIDDRQIQIILDEQQQSKLKFGELAIAKGWVQQTTVNFFLRYLAPSLSSRSKKTERSSLIEQPSKLSREYYDGSTTYNQKIVSDSLDYSQKVHRDFFKIKLKLLNLEDQDAFSEQVLERVLWWTGGQSFLTQKLFQLISKQEDSFSIAQEVPKIDYLVENKILNDWEDKELATHFQTIKERLCQNQQVEPEKLLRFYQQVLTNSIFTDDSQEQRELLKIGLVIKQQGQLIIANPIYKSIFNRAWTARELNNLESQNLSAITLVPENSTDLIAKRENLGKSFRFRNILLLFALIALLSLFFNNLVRRMAVKSAFSKGNELLKQKSFEEAVEEYNSLLNLDSNYFQAWTNRGYALAGLEKYEQMRESCSTATIIEPTAVYAWNCLGEALHNLKQEDSAIMAFDKAISLEKNDPIFLINKSESLKALGKEEESLTVTKEAIKVLEKIEAIEGKERVRGEFAVALTFLGNGYRKNKQYAIAVDSYKRALEYSPNYFPAQIGKGIVLNRVKRYQEAEDEFKKILDNTQLSKGRQAQTWFYLGKTLCESRQNTAGIAAFAEAIKLRADYEAAKNAKIRCS